MGSDKVFRITGLILKIFITVLSFLIFLFALFSGAEGFGGGLRGVIRNSPNALPWLVLFVFVYFLWKREIVGGILLVVFSVFTIFMFDVFDDNLGVFLIISLPLLLTGAFFLYKNLRRNNRRE